LDCIEKLARFIGGEYRSCPFDDVLQPAHRVRRVDGHHLAGHKPVEEHAHGGEALLHARLGVRLLKLLDLGGNDGRPDVRKIGDTVVCAPTEEVTDGAAVGPAQSGGKGMGSAMNFYFDESGDFRVPRAGHKVAVVMGVVISDAVQQILFAKFEDFVSRLTSGECHNGEPKGSLLSSTHREQFCELLVNSGGVVITPVTLDLSSLDAEYERSVSERLSAILAQRAQEMLYLTARDQLLLIARQFRNLSSSQALRIYSWANCFREAIQHAFLFLAGGQHERSWERVVFEIDRVQVRAASREEKVFSLMLLAWLTGWSRRFPFALIREVHTPAHPIVQTYDTPDGIDLGKLIRGNVRWKTSSESLGLQIADIACNIVFQAAQDLDDRRGAVRRYGLLMRASPYGPSRGPGLFSPRRDAPAETGTKYRALWKVMRASKEPTG
jgi:hypothetical protein